MSVSRFVTRASFLFVLFAAGSASANTPEAVSGLGARNNAMAGAGTAIANDFTATYYNPAGLGYCGRSEFGLDLRHTMYGLHARTNNPDLPPRERTRDMTRATLGACFRLPYRLSLGIIFGTGLQSSAGIDQRTADDTPQFLLHGEANNQFTIAMALAYRPIRQLSIGVGAAIIISSDLDIDVFAPIGVSLEEGGFEELEFDLHWGLRPTAAPYVGITAQPIPELKLAATYRGPLKHHLNINVPTGVITGIPGFPELELTLPLVVTADTWYQPRELALGFSVDPIPELTITGDLTWYNYAAFNKSTYPFLGVGWDRMSNEWVTALIGLPQADPIGYHDVWQPRIAAELRLLDGRLGVRAGYSVRRAAVAIPVLRNTTILDNTVNALSFGAGYTFGPRTQDEVAAYERARRATAEATDGAAQEEARVAFGDERSDLDDSLGGMPVMLRLDGYFRASFLRERHDTHKDIRYGGNIMEMGITSSIGWY